MVDIFDLFYIFTSSHSHILRFLCTCLYPHILASSCLCVLACILASSHPNIFRLICPFIPCILISSGSCVLGCILASLHPYILRFVSVSLYPCILFASHILRFMCACLYLCILISSYDLAHVSLLVPSHLHIFVSLGLSILASMLTSSGQCVLDMNE